MRPQNDMKKTIALVLTAACAVRLVQPRRDDR